MKRILTFSLLLLPSYFAFGITATKAYVDAATNATLTAAKQYTDEHGGGCDTNVVKGIVSSASVTNQGAVAAALADAAAKYLPLTGGEYHPMTGTLYLGGNYINASKLGSDKRFEIGDGCITVNGTDPDTIYYFPDNLQALAYTQYVASQEWVTNSTAIRDTFPIVTNAYTKAEADGRFATSNMVESVFGANADYALTDLTGTAVTLASGEIGNVTLTAAQTAITVTLDFSAAADRSGDALLYLVNDADTSLAVAPASVVPVGYDLSTALGAGTNLVMFTRLKKSGATSTVLVTVKEIE